MKMVTKMDQEKKDFLHHSLEKAFYQMLQRIIEYLLLYKELHYLGHKLINSYKWTLFLKMNSLIVAHKSKSILKKTKSYKIHKTNRLSKMINSKATTFNPIWLHVDVVKELAILVYNKMIYNNSR